MLIQSSLIFLLAFVINLFLVRFLIRFAWKKKIVGTHKNFLGKEVTVPILGGLGIYFTFTILALFNFSFFDSKCIQAILIGGTLIIITGILDDKMDLSPLIKILFQIFVALIIIYFGVRTEIIYLSPFSNLVITLLWIVGITNALNLLDIMDGLCGGLSLIMALTFFILALIGRNIPVAIISAILAGGSLAFLIYNFPPAKIFLGNSGSLFLGFVFSVLAITLDYAPSGKYAALLTPVIVLALPFYDTFFVMIMRGIKRKPVFLKTKDHLAMRLLVKGYSEKKILFYMFGLSIIFSVSALLISLSSDLIGIIILGILLILLGLITKRMSMVRVVE